MYIVERGKIGAAMVGGGFVGGNGFSDSPAPSCRDRRPQTPT